MKSTRTLLVAGAWAMIAFSPGVWAAEIQTSLARQEAAVIDGIARKFTDNLVAGDAKAVVAVFVDSSPLMTGKVAEISNLEGQVATAFKIYGKVSSVELASEKVIGTTAVRRYYLARHQNLVTRWELDFAHTGGGWTMTYFGFDDQQRTWFSD